ncbi:MAG: TatD family hydrolase [Gammaproteobacteria bacterium]|nr:TatD family hydrolase [Gammaproteobacteria bacterium]
MLIDSHCHLDRLDLTPYGGDLSKALTAAEAKDVRYFLSVSVTLEDMPKLHEYSEKFSNVFISVGQHPHEATQQKPDSLSLLRYAEHPKVIALGETGLDYYRLEEENEKLQEELFRLHIAVARKTKKPLIIHSRQARLETLNILKEEKARDVGGVLHCFTEDWSMAKCALDLGFYISFSGILTFKNAEELRQVAEQVPLERILIETDAPYLAPMPMRGKPNEPLYLPYVALKLSEIKGLSYERISEQTNRNFSDCFHVELKKV